MALTGDGDMNQGQQEHQVLYPGPGQRQELQVHQVQHHQQHQVQYRQEHLAQIPEPSPHHLAQVPALGQDLGSA